MLKREGIQFQVCRNPAVKCSVVERAHRTIRERLYKYLIYKNTYTYMDVLPQFFRAYNDPVLSTTGMAHSRVTDSGVLAIWKRMEARRRGVHVAKAMFRVGKDVRISKVNMKFSKSAEQNFSAEIFQIVKAAATPLRIGRFKRDAYRGSILSEITYPDSRHETYSHKIDKILNKQVRRRILENLVRWRVFSKDFDP